MIGRFAATGDGGGCRAAGGRGSSTRGWRGHLDSKERALGALMRVVYRPCVRSFGLHFLVVHLGREFVDLADGGRFAGLPHPLFFVVDVAVGDFGNIELPIDCFAPKRS